MDKEKRIEELNLQIAEAKTTAIHKNAEMLKSLHPDLTKEQALVEGEILLDKMIESSKRSRDLIETLNSCQTMEQIHVWRQENNI